MKKPLALISILGLALLFSLAACGVPAAENVNPETTSESAEDIVVFTDPVLERMVREAMDKPEGDITVAEAAAVKVLDLDIEWQSPEEMRIKDISALKYFINLDQLQLQFHAITDVSPLAGLTKLRGLGLGGNNISDITPLSGLKELRGLSLFNCQATDYSPLKNLTLLHTLFIEWSTISDLSMLSDMKELQTLSIANTQVADVSPLTGLTQLKVLKLENCPVTDLSPLAAIYPNLTEKDFEMN